MFNCAASETVVKHVDNGAALNCKNVENISDEVVVSELFHGQILQIMLLEVREKICNRLNIYNENKKEKKTKETRRRMRGFYNNLWVDLQELKRHKYNFYEV